MVHPITGTLISGCLFSAIYFTRYQRISSYFGQVDDVQLAAAAAAADNVSFNPLPLFYDNERQQQQRTPADYYDDAGSGGCCRSSESCGTKDHGRCYALAQRNSGAAVAEFKDYTAFNEWLSEVAVDKQQQQQRKQRIYDDVDDNYVEDAYDETYDYALWICRKWQKPQTSGGSSSSSSSSNNGNSNVDSCKTRGNDYGNVFGKRAQRRGGDNVIAAAKVTLSSIGNYRNRECFAVLPTSQSVKHRLLDSCLEYDTNRYIVNIVQTWLFPIKQWLSGYSSSAGGCGMDSCDKYDTVAAFFPTCRVRVSSLVFSSRALAVNGLHTPVEYVDVASYLSGNGNDAAARIDRDESILSFRRKLVKLLIFSATEFDDTTRELNFRRRLTNHSSCFLSPLVSQREQPPQEQQRIDKSQTDAEFSPQQQQPTQPQPPPPQQQEKDTTVECVVWESASSDKFYVFVARHKATRYVFLLNAQRSIYMACDDSVYGNWSDNRLIYKLLLRNGECRLYGNCHGYVLKAQYLLQKL